MTVRVIGIDIAKRVFQVHGMDEQGKTVLRQRLTRVMFLEEMARLPACLIGLEAGSGAHHWGRCLAELGQSAVPAVNMTRNRAAAWARCRGFGGTGVDPDRVANKPNLVGLETFWQEIPP